MANVTIVVPPRPDNPSEVFDFEEWLPNQIFPAKVNFNQMKNDGFVAIEEDTDYIKISKGALTPDSIIAIWKVTTDGIRIGLCFSWSDGADEYYVCPLTDMFYVGTGDLAGHYLADLVGINPANKYVARGVLVDVGTNPPTSGDTITGSAIKSCWSPWVYLETTDNEKYVLVWAPINFIIAAAIVVGVILASAALAAAVAWWNASEAEKAKAFAEAERIKMLTNALEKLMEKCDENPKVCEALGPAVSDIMAAQTENVGSDTSNPPSNPLADAFNWLKDNILPIASIVGLLFVLIKFDIIRKVIESITERLRG